MSEDNKNNPKTNQRSNRRGKSFRDRKSSAQSRRRRNKPGGLLKARIIQYKPGKKTGLLMLLEGSNKFKQIFFNGNSFEKSIEHYIYPNQVVNIRTETVNDQLTVAKVEFTPNYRKIKGDEEGKELKKDKTPSTLRNLKTTKPITKKDSKLPKEPKKDVRKKRKKATPKRPEEKLNKSISDLSSALEDLDTSSGIDSSNLKEEKTPKSTPSEKLLSNDVDIDSLNLNDMVKGLQEPVLPQDKEIDDSKGDINDLANMLSDIDASPPPKEEKKSEPEDLNALLGSLDESTPPTSAQDPETEELSALLGSIDETTSLKESTQNPETEDLNALLNDMGANSSDTSDSVPEDAYLNELVSTLSSSDDADEDAVKQFKAMQELISQETSSEAEEKEDDGFQSGFQDPDSPSFKRRMQEQESKKEPAQNQKTLKEELAEDKGEETFLEKLVIGAEEEIEEDDEYEYVYEDPNEVHVEEDAEDEDVADEDVADEDVADEKSNDEEEI